MGMSFIFLLLAFKHLASEHRRLAFLRALGPLTVVVLSIALMNIFKWYQPASDPLIKPVGAIPKGAGRGWVPAAAEGLCGCRACA